MEENTLFRNKLFLWNSQSLVILALREKETLITQIICTKTLTLN